MPRLILSALFALAVVFSTAMAESPHTLSVLQYNIQQRPTEEGREYQTIGRHSRRSKLSTIYLPVEIKPLGADIVTVNEAFTAALRPPLKENMAQNGYLHATDVLNKDATLRPWSGGVMLFSKYPIKETREYQYENYASFDRFAAKGVLYVQIEKQGSLYHIFATHTNASYSLKDGRVPLDDGGREARRGQFEELCKFIDSQNIGKDEPVIIAGDMNVDMLSEQGQTRNEYADMLKTMNAVHPERPRDSWPFTLDEESNEWVAKGDGQQWLDYVLYAADYKRPSKSMNKAIKLKHIGSDLSDHYPVLAVFEF